MMGEQFKPMNVNDQHEEAVSRTLSVGLHDFNQQCLRVLHCTAKAMVSSPGGLRFKPGTRPWLDDLVGNGPCIQALRAVPSKCD